MGRKNFGETIKANEELPKKIEKEKKGESQSELRELDEKEKAALGKVLKKARPSG